MHRTRGWARCNEKCLVCLVAGDHQTTRLSPTGNRGGVRLGLPDPEHLCIARRAGTLHRRAPVLENQLPGILDLNLLSALHAVRLSHGILLLRYNPKGTRGTQCPDSHHPPMSAGSQWRQVTRVLTGLMRVPIEHRDRRWSIWSSCDLLAV